MSKHVWRIRRQGLGGHITIRCDDEGCAGWLTIEQAEARLNEYETLKKEIADKDLIIKQRGREIRRLFKYKEATEALSAEDARIAGHYYLHNIMPVNAEPFLAYASVLEGKDSRPPAEKGDEDV